MRDVRRHQEHPIPRRRSPLTALLVLAAAAGAPAQIFTTDAGVRSPELPSVRELLVVRNYRDATETRAVTEVVWSPTRRFETDLELPLVRWDLETLPSTGLDGDVAGLGDAIARGKLALLRDDGIMSSNRIALLGSLRVPTGDDDRTLGGTRLPRRLQPGFGAPGFGIGLAGTIVRDRHRASLSAEWLHASAHEGFDPGDEIHLDAAWWYRLSPAGFAPDVAVAEHRLVAELRNIHRFADHEGGVRATDDGLRSELVLGLQTNLSDRRFRLEVGALLPLFEENPSGVGRFRGGGVLTLTAYF